MGVDVGGTKILIGMASADGEVLRERRYPTDTSSNEAILRSVYAAVDDFWMTLTPADPRPAAIGLGLVGGVDHRAGVWKSAVNIPIKNPEPVAHNLQQRYGVPVALDNDVHCSTLAESRLGAGRGVSDFVLISIGTGVSVGIVANGSLVHGAGNYAGEAGHMVVSDDPTVCKCGRIGCVEPLLSGGGIITATRALLPTHPESSLHRWGTGLHAGHVYAAAAEGDPLAVFIADRAVDCIKKMTVNVVNLLNPELVVFSGGALPLARLTSEVIPHLRTTILPITSASLRDVVLAAVHPEKAGLVGACCLAFDLLDQPA